MFTDRAAKRREANYTYYIFSDGDIKLRQSNFKYQAGVTKEFERIKYSKKNNYEKFEDFLLTYRPAVGSVENQYKHLQFKLAVDVKLFIMNFDAQFNGYHHSVLDDLLPYDNKEQDYSVWISQAKQQCKTFFRYHGLVYSFMPVYALNDKHSEYPRGTLAPYKISCYEEYINSPVSNQTKHLLLSKLAFSKLFNIMSRAKATIQKYSNDSLVIMEKNSKTPL